MRRILIGYWLPVLLLVAPAAPRATPPSPHPAPERLAVGQAARGTLTASDSAHGGRLVDLWTFQASRGEVIEVTLESDEFDPRLALAGEWVTGVIENDNDGDEGRGSRIELVVPADGDYSITATSADPGAKGRYTVRVGRPSWANALETRRVIRFGELWDGRLTASDAKAEESHHHDYLYTAKEGESTSFTLTSPEIDSYLTIGRLAGDRFYELASDDDSGGGLDSRLAVTFPTAGVWVVRVSTAEHSKLGDYRIEAGSLMPVLTRTGSQAGEVSDHDARLASGLRYDEYQYLAEKGQTVVIEAASSEFAPTVLVGEDGDTGFEVLARSGEGGARAARLEYTFPKAGDYFVRVSPATLSGRGSYTVRVR